MEPIIDLFLHFDEHLLEWVTAYGAWVYAILFIMIFAETGLVVTPFLPGDSLLFAAGAIAATKALDVRLTAVLLTVAAVAGDAVNYSMGRMVGERIFRPSAHPGRWQRLVNRDHLDRAHEFFERYGGKAIVVARFVPIVRTFVPFVAGAASMSYPSFAFYNVTGGMLWVGLCVGAGYWFGNVPIVRDNFSLVAIAIVILSVIPVVVEYFSHAKRARGPAA
jgi:membrane-associated protein